MNEILIPTKKRRYRATFGKFSDVGEGCVTRSEQAKAKKEGNQRDGKTREERK